MTDVYYVHRGGLLSLSALSVFFMATDYLREDEIGKDMIAQKSKEGLKAFTPILNDGKVVDWMREVGINRKKSHNWIILNHGELIDFYWMSYGDKDSMFISEIFRKINAKSSLSPDFIYRQVYEEYTFFRSFTALREIKKLYPA